MIWFLREVFEGVAGVHNAIAPGQQLEEVEAIVFGGDEHAVEAADSGFIPVDGGGAGPGGVLAGGWDDGDVGIVVTDGGTFGLEEIHEFEGG